MRGSIKLKVLLIGFFSFLFALLANRNSEGAVYAFEICTLRTYTMSVLMGLTIFLQLNIIGIVSRTLDIYI